MSKQLIKQRVEELVNNHGAAEVAAALSSVFDDYAFGFKGMRSHGQLISAAACMNKAVHHARLATSLNVTKEQNNEPR